MISISWNMVLKDVGTVGGNMRRITDKTEIEKVLISMRGTDAWLLAICIQEPYKDTTRPHIWDGMKIISSVVTGDVRNFHFVMILDGHRTSACVADIDYIEIL